jgi:hypothetical protein
MYAWLKFVLFIISVLYELNLFRFKVRVEAQVEEFDIGKKQFISIHI